jgi:hypothetical protein
MMTVPLNNQLRKKSFKIVWKSDFLYLSHSALSAYHIRKSWVRSQSSLGDWMSCFELSVGSEVMREKFNNLKYGLCSCPLLMLSEHAL